MQRNITTLTSTRPEKFLNFWLSFEEKTLGFNLNLVSSVTRYDSAQVFDVKLGGT